jgi:hypothetical protein
MNEKNIGWILSKVTDEAIGERAVLEVKSEQANSSSSGDAP